ncbi:MAG TPA: PRC-barrel domain-containing protein [Sphingomicrobium sp.]|jgi:sporulation protein YlmC with PRC-barrel domain|nr:PRC-barrel domain-containing protein [Sphingomicrobium sp.]
MRLTDLRDKAIRTLDGEKLGRVHEVHCEKGRITALISGPGGLLERLTARKHGRRIPWECVRRVDSDQVVVTPDPPQRIVKKKPSAARSRQGTRRPSGQRSKR